MQSALRVAPDSLLPQLPWKTHRTRSAIQNPNLYRPKAFVPSMSLRTSCGYDFEGTEIGDVPAAFRLPIVIRKSGSISRYFWDGTHLQLVCIDGDASKNWFTSDDWFRKFYQFCKTAVRNFFIPHQVQGNYMEYVKWKFLHRVFSSALQVLATQAMFRAMGFGYSRSLPSAAALNWVLKDGLGRLSRCIYTATLASAFDTNLKMSAVHRSFAIADNLGEVSAKSQIQTVCFDNLGLMLAALLNMLCKNSLRLQAGLPFIVYPLFAAVDLFGIYQGLKHVHLQTLTKGRIEIILNTWIQLGFVPSPAEVSKEEGIDFQWKKDDW